MTDYPNCPYCHHNLRAHFLDLMEGKDVIVECQRNGCYCVLFVDMKVQATQ